MYLLPLGSERPGNSPPVPLFAAPPRHRSPAGPQGNGNITFFDDGARFQGAAEFPGEGPVGYRGSAAS
ncbi:hypothetical protein BBK14_26595 [Parafrankia soli]|uniref:OAA-family lectin sugar binding domain-containing protein n=1 Tax=Parafrankia soli TaxID=2599596 RepID=A0A1S1PK52_9ACTN|nr:hypothetical protein [Parafrankia soli]OHV21479.1 hypothetical protein BBK14_26595 [Parafrankia soli]